jgi:hypothetical protein
MNMICIRCKERFGSDEADLVETNFNEPISGMIICFACAEEIWAEREQAQTMSDTCQDEGDNPKERKP